MKCLHLSLRACGKVLLLVAWVWLVLPSTVSPRGMLPLELWCQVQGSSWEDHTSSRLRFVEDGPTRSIQKCLGLYGADEEFVWNRGGQKTNNNRLLSRGYRAYRPTIKHLLTANYRSLQLEWAQRWENMRMTHWQHVIFGDEYRFQLYPGDGISLLLFYFTFICCN